MCDLFLNMITQVIIHTQTSDMPATTGKPSSNKILHYIVHSEVVVINGLNVN